MSGGAPAALHGRLLFVAANPSVDRLYELDRLLVGEIQRPRAIVAGPGGKGLNAARAAAAIGGSAIAIGIVAGRAGDWIVEQLEALGIEARVARSTGETRTCVSVLDRSSGALTEIYERGTEIEPGAWYALEAIIRAELERGDIATVALSGSLPPGAPPDGYARIARIARAIWGAAPVLADTYGPALTAVLAEHPAIVKVNGSEAAAASGIQVVDAASAVEAARVLCAAGAASVIVTLDREGAVVVTAGERHRIVPPDLRGAYPVGSGDAFLGGMAVALGRGASVVEAARLGLAAGIANAQIPGAGSLETATVERILDQIRVTGI